MKKIRTVTKKRVWIIGGILVAVVLILLGASYSEFLGAKIAPGQKFKILGPTVLHAGETATVTWDASTQNAKQYPYEKIEYCYGKLVKRKCVVLVAIAPNTGKAVVKVPATLPKGKGNLQLTARDTKKKLVSSLVNVSKTVTVEQAKATSSVADNKDSKKEAVGSSGHIMTAEEIKNYYPIVYSPVSVQIDYTKSLENMIQDAGYTKVDTAITSSNFPLAGTGTSQIQVRSIRFGDPQCPGGSISTQNALQEIAKLGFQPAKIEQVIAFERQIALASNFAYVALGSSWLNPQDGLTYVPLFMNVYEKEIELRKTDGSWSCADVSWQVR